MNEKQAAALTSRTRDQQVLASINKARQHIATCGYFEWDAFFGSFITTAHKVSYIMCPECYNYVPNSRVQTGATLVNVTAAPNNDASFDDTYNLTKYTATGASPSVTRFTDSAETLNGRRISGSVWLKVSNATGEAPGTVTLTLADTVGGQAQTLTVTNDGSLQRYGLSGYFTAAQSRVQLKVSWTSTTGVLWVDQFQIEDNDWCSEVIVNANPTGKQLRTSRVDPHIIHSIATYVYNKPITWDQIVLTDSSIYLYDHIQSPAMYNRTRYGMYSLRGNQLNIQNAEAGVHYVYRGMRIPPIYTSGTELIDIPLPYVMTLFQGAVAFEKLAAYDLRSNDEGTKAEARFKKQIEEDLISIVPAPAYTTISPVIAVMMV